MLKRICCVLVAVATTVHAEQSDSRILIEANKAIHCLKSAWKKDEAYPTGMEQILQLPNHCLPIRQDVEIEPLESSVVIIDGHAFIRYETMTPVFFDLWVPFLGISYTYVDQRPGFVLVNTFPFDAVEH